MRVQIKSGASLSLVEARALPPSCALVLCTETDDYCAPRGVDLHTGKPFVFDALLGSYECPPGVERGTIYVVWATGPRAGWPIGENIDQFDPRAMAELHLRCHVAKAEGKHRPWTVSEANTEGLRQRWWQDMALTRCRGCWIPVARFARAQ